ncbi:MAG TPA: PhzF family phenazine biosynthesis protein [Synergistaceae bacterium]|jgi:PhzF family phenazine biosynthesis protein|nr:PhzF family phenazine biosynthesis protein [Synergistaceae bacterium]NLL41470.1 PhzF family phenazine biosynthesis protein [Synergistaceae bacterium]HPX03921.1 PhzF family phenazine biosynthesis protein [Synergistaceae bacterium]HQA54889.1 PhzF family phenazine biosynthesis protein [Synergistaceae bacterium]
MLFTKGRSSGNPAGYVLLDSMDSLSEEEMQKLASELKGFVSEVGFVFGEAGGFHLRYYSSECEVAFCGHATIAIMYDLISTDPVLLEEKELRIRVKAGTLPVFNRLREEDAVYITAPEPEFLRRDISRNEIAEALGADADAVKAERALRVIDGGLRTLIVPMASLSDCIKLFPDQKKLRNFSIEKDFDIVHVYTDEVSTKGTKYRTRVFAPKYGYLEDPATGSGNSAFGYYLIDEGMWEDDLSIEQGPSLNFPNIVRIKRLTGERADRILFGGSATTRIEGKYHLH